MWTFRETWEWGNLKQCAMSMDELLRWKKDKGPYRSVVECFRMTTKNFTFRRTHDFSKKSIIADFKRTSVPGFSAKTLSIIFKVFKENINFASLLGDKIFSNYCVEFANLTSPSFRSVGWVFKAAVRKSKMPCRCQHCLITLRYLSYFQLLRPKFFVVMDFKPSRQ